MMWLIECIFWVAAFACGIGYLPSVSGIMCLLGVVILFPMSRWQSYLTSKIRWTVAQRNAAFAVLLFGGVAITEVGSSTYIAVAIAGIVVLIAILKRTLNPSKAAAADAIRARKAADRAIKMASNRADAKERRSEKRANWKENRTPVKAVLIGTSTSKGCATKRGLMGVLAFGTVGALAAAVGEDDQATFSVKYESGRTGTETVKIGSLRYRQLSAVLVE